ncbi:hypothetical protein [Pseudopontixanthobacter vadosimaris]|uniref:hypothetical protein n=1 Tax=Pseudopontixanthobacter vadosimaris TaxID=2726450 RepID=UPI001474DBFD|nr:hypothetical protein [Pseudopontixanthobacter vadosimaris]
MGLLKMAALGTLGYAGYKYYTKNKNPDNAAFAAGQPGNTNVSQVRDAGPGAMRDGAATNWTRTDEASDESFPASDPPATY